MKQTSALSALALALLAQPASAVILLGSGDPAYNTTPPTGALAGSGRNLRTTGWTLAQPLTVGFRWVCLDNKKWLLSVEGVNRKEV